MVNNFLMGGKLGDFLHSMFAVKQICLRDNIVANIYMYDIGWEFGIENTYTELSPILLQQNYIKSVKILKNCKITQEIQTAENNTPLQVFDEQVLSEGYIDLGSYIRSPLLYKACWSELYAKTFNFDIKTKLDHSWIDYDRINPDLVNRVLVHRRRNPVRINHNFPYEDIIENYRDQILFISGNENDYLEFEHKDKVDYYKVSTLEDWFTSINSCSLMISNLTSPAVIAHCLDKPRIIELPNALDAIHCMGEEKYSNNIHWYINSDCHNL